MTIWKARRGVVTEAASGGSLPGANDPVASPIVVESPLEDRGERWVGYIDYISSIRISGWACDLVNPSMSVMVEAISSGGKRVVSVANVFREDVRDAGYGNGRLGFDLDIGQLRLTSGTVIVRFVGSGALISAAPIELDPQRALISGTLSEHYAPMMQAAAAHANRTFAVYNDTGSVF